MAAHRVVVRGRGVKDLNAHPQLFDEGFISGVIARATLEPIVEKLDELRPSSAP